MLGILFGLSIILIIVILSFNTLILVHMVVNKKYNYFKELGFAFKEIFR
jgi:hypothetical protein